MQRCTPFLLILACCPAPLRAQDAPAKPEVLHAIDWRDFDQGFPAHVFQTGISHDGKLFFGAGDSGYCGLIRVLDVGTGKDVRIFSLAAQQGVLKFSTAAFVPGDKLVVGAYHAEKDIYLWDIATGAIVQRLRGHTEFGIGMAVAPDGKRLLSWSDDRTVRLWDLATGKELRKLTGHADKAVGTFAPDGSKILTYSPDGTLRLWQTDTGRELLKFTGHAGPCTASFSPDGKQVLSFGADKTIRLWDMESGKEIRRFAGGFVKDGARGFIANGKQLAGYCDDRKFRVWKTASAKVVREIDLSNVGGDAWTMTASPDGRLALVSHVDGSVRVIDLATGRQIHRYDNCRTARFFSFSPDGNYAVSGSFRAGMRVYRLPSVAAVDKKP